MRKIFVCIAFLGLFAAVTACGQNQIPVAVKTAPKKVVSSNPAEISETDWLKMADAMYQEKWETASILALQNLQKLKTENDKKQLAQLRYIYLYSLAGKVAEGKMTFDNFESVANSFIGQEFMIVSRQILADCNTKINYICAAKDDGKNRILRVTATNRSGTAIHLFEYVVLNESFDVRENNEKLAFISGNLKKVESNPYKPGMKIARLIFNNGYVKIATD